jgi:cytochrome c
MRLSKSVRRIAALAGAASTLALLASPAFAGDAARGAQLFKGTCGVCHLAQPHPAISDLAMRIGPNLWGVVGRKAGTAQHFRYSAAMVQSGIVWTPDRLRPYIHEPQKTIPNIRMSYQGEPDLKKVDDIIAYLQTFR